IFIASWFSGGPQAAWSGLAFMVLLFVCVLAHEFGHIFTARAFGVATPDVTLLPIGGVARLERIPEKPSEELLVALAGPAVNVVIAISLVAFAGAQLDAQHLSAVESSRVSLIDRLAAVNLFLAIFNMIPAFPMDGGRVLRAVLAMRMNYARATQVAASVGQGIAFIFFIIGLWSNPMLLLIAVFIYFGASSEAAFAQMKTISRDLRVSAAMVTQFQSLPLDATLNDAVEALLRTSQHEFPVTDELGKVRGILTRDEMIAALPKSGPETAVSDVMRRDIPSVPQSMLFDRAYALMQKCRCPALPVLDASEKVVGLFTPENVGEMIMVQSALSARAR
ncbi:MAG: site-2 protease family protein, partial [Verrucomicrobia bacterium]